MKSNPKRAMTLVEILITLSISGLLIAGLTTFFINTYKLNFTSNQRIFINSDIRKITNEMTENARDATIGLVYASFYPDPINGDFRSPATDMTAQDYQLRDNETGDLLVLVYYDQDPNPADTVRPPIVRLVGYYRSIDDPVNNIGPVRRFDIAISGSDQNKAVEELIPSVASQEDHALILEFSRGLANGHLFYNFRSRGIMVNGQIYHGNAAKRVTNTYNFTITPRGPRGNEQYP
jgi:prepilin-type N-terminal cleavage/methylation domain-containing protein